MTMPLARTTLLSTAVVAPEQVAPLMPWTPSDVIRRSAAAVAAAASMQVLSPRTVTTSRPPRKMPLSDTSLIAISPPSAIGLTSDSVGPVKPCIIPILTGSCAEAPIATVAQSAADIILADSFLMVRPPIWLYVCWSLGEEYTYRNQCFHPSLCQGRHVDRRHVSTLRPVGAEQVPSSLTSRRMAGSNSGVRLVLERTVR